MVPRRPPSPRRVVALAILALLAPTVVSGVTHALAGPQATANASAQHSVENLTIVTAQGRNPDVVDDPGGVEIVDAASNARVWAHDDPRCMRYYDAEPVDDATLLLTANCRVDDGSRRRFAVEYDWRAGEVDRLFAIPSDTHDVDRLGPHRYAVADIRTDTAYVYNYTADATAAGLSFRGRAAKSSVDQDHVWAFQFGDDTGWPGAAELKGNHTHLNDVDSVYGGDAFLLSPRNFNRVVAVNRTTRDVMWTLGDQRDLSVLAGQHHPALLDTDPVTVLVGDSLNNRVVEYQRVSAGSAGDLDGDGWKRTWIFAGAGAGGLNWPRDVHRLPNGNTLVMDSGNDRALEVAPNGTVVWEYETMANPYDVDRYAHGDQPAGPTMASIRGGDAAADGESTGITPLERYHRIAGYVLPPWIGKWAFACLAAAALLAVGWAATELGVAARRRL